MKYAALTGISPSVIAELKSGKARTLELSSAHNIITLTEATPGECLFLTSVNEEDLPEIRVLWSTFWHSTSA